MATLILMIPFNAGVLFLADRVSSRSDGSNEAWDKIYSMQTLNAVIGFAGYSEITRRLAQILASNPAPVPIEQLFASCYNQAVSSRTDDKEQEMESLCAVRTDGNFRLLRFTQKTPILLENNVPHAVGSGAPAIRPQLNRPTNVFDLPTVLRFGKTLIQYSSQSYTSVGPPGMWGFGYAVLPTVGDVILDRIAPEIIGIESMIYKF